MHVSDVFALTKKIEGRSWVMVDDAHAALSQHSIIIINHHMQPHAKSSLARSLAAAWPPTTHFPSIISHHHMLVCVCVCLLWLSVCLSVRVKRRRRDNLRKGPLTSASSSYPTPSLHVHPELSLPPPVSYVGLDLLSCCPLFASTGPGQPGLSVEIPSSRLRYA